MGRKLIKGVSGQTLGFIIEQGDRKEIFDPAGKLLGFYLKSQDKTFTASGACVGFGDQINILLVR